MYSSTFKEALSAITKAIDDNECIFPDRETIREPAVAFEYGNNKIYIHFFKNVDGVDFYWYWCSNWHYPRTSLAFIMNGMAYTCQLGKDKCGLSIAVHKNGSGGGKELIDNILRISELRLLLAYDSV